MNFSKAKVYLTLKSIAGILLLSCSCLLFAGCTQNGTAESSEAEAANDADGKNKAAIQAVIEKEFNGPDKTYRELWDAATAAQTGDMDEEEYNAWLETPEYKELISYTEYVYSPYFTENAYETFSRTDAFRFSLYEKAFKLTTSDIKITQSEHGETLYDFTFQVLYENEKGETGDFDFDGNAIVPEPGKIGKIQYNDKDGLQQKISE